MTREPEHPADGRIVRLPIALPPMLTRSIGYGGSGRYLELSWSPDHQHVRWSDSPANSA